MIDNSKVIPADKLKDVLITRTAIKTFQSETVVEKIISHQFFSIKEAFKTKKQVEIADLGKFQVSQVKLRRRLKELEDMKISIEDYRERSNLEGRRLSSVSKKIEVIGETIEKLKAKR